MSDPGSRRRGAATILVLVLAAALHTPHSPAQEVAGREGPRGGPARGDGAALSTARSAATVFVSRRVRLAPPDVAALVAEDVLRAAEDTTRGLRRVGVLRPMDAVRAPLRFHGNGDTELMLDGTRVWRLRIEAPGAKGVRVRFRRLDLPEGARLFVADADDPAERYGPLKAGEDGGLTPTVFGESLLVEVEVPARSVRRRVRVEADEVAWIYRDLAEPRGFRASLGCMNDVAEAPSWLANESRGVALMEFTEGRAVYSCTGTLLADSDDGTVVPWFLTANHCISTEQAARTAELFWDYRASVPGGSPPDLSTVPRTSGTALVVTREETDMTLLRVTGSLPADRFFCGWSAATVPSGTSVVGLHHPEATQMRISRGTLDPPDGEFHTVVWDDGVTAQGSSGSALFDPQRRVIGQLCCGGSSCNRPKAPDYYGRMDLSYPYLEDHLGAGGAGGGDDPAPPDDPWDPVDDDPAGAVALGGIPGAGLSHGPHTLSSTDLVDWFALDLPAGVEVTLRSSGADDVRAALFGDPSDPQPLAADDDSGGGGQFRIDHLAPAGGVHWLRVTAATSGAGASYTLVASRGATGPVPEPVERLRVRVRRGSQVLLTWRDRARGESGYRVERLSGGTWLRVGDLPADARRFREEPGPGNHLYRVGPFNANGTAWTETGISLGGGGGGPPEDGDPGGEGDPADDTPAGANPLLPASGGQTGTHTLDRRDRADWFRIELTAGRTYTFATTGDGDTMGALFDGPDAPRPLAENDDGSRRDLNFRLAHRARRTGTHYVRVTAFPGHPDARYRLVWESR